MTLIAAALLVGSAVGVVLSLIDLYRRDPGEPR